MYSDKTESQGFITTDLGTFLGSPVNLCGETETDLPVMVPGSKTFLGMSGRKMEIKAVEVLNLTK